MTPSERLKRTRNQSGLSVRELSKLTGIGEKAIRAHETGQNGIRPEAAEKYASALSVQPEFILFGTTPSNLVEGFDVRMIPRLGVVQAGAWHELVEAEPEPDDYIPWNDPTYARARRVYALTVLGPSMNRHYPDGSTVIVCDAVECGVREGDHVVVRRTRGSLVETTLKEVVVNKAGEVELWPRSTDQAFQTPLVLERVRDADEGPAIIGVVIATYASRPPRTGPLLL